MNKNAGSKIIAIAIILLVVVSSVVVYLVLDRLDFFDQKPEPVVEEIPEEEELDSIAIKVIDMMQQLDEPMIRGYIEKLDSFGAHTTARRMLYKLSNRPIIGRFFDLPIEKVAKYLYSEFESMGLEVRYQYWEEEPTLKNLMKPNYYPGWLVGDNVIATLPGTDPSSDEIYVLLAHYDTMGRLVAGGPCVGSNDDSSGVAAILAAAKLMSQYSSFNHTVVFLAVSGEEQGLLGTHAYAEEALKNNDNIVAAFSIDMIGNRAPGYRDTEVMIAGYNDSFIVNFTVNVNQRYPEFLNLTIIHDDPMNHASDHKAFIKRGYDAVLIEEAVEDYEWHRSTDTIDKMDTYYTTEVSRLVLAVAAEMAWDVEYR